MRSRATFAIQVIAYVLYRRNVYVAVITRLFQNNFSEAEVYAEEVVIWHRGVLNAVQVELPRVILVAL